MKENERTFETYQPRLVEPNNVKNPSCFNGMVMIRRYKVTVEEIEEPKEVLLDRLRDLYKDKANGHLMNRRAMREECRKLGFDPKELEL